MELRTIRFSSYFHNDGKFERLSEIDQEVKSIKNKISIYILDNFDKLLFDKKSLLSDYKLFKIDSLSAWETQSIFQDIIKLYENQLQKRKQNIDFRIQSSINVEHYKKKTKHHEVGDVKNFKIISKKTNLCKVTKYLVYCDLNKKLPDKIIDNYKNKIWFTRLLSFVKQKQLNLIKSIRLITFSTGTYRKSTSENGSNKSSYIYKDDTNGLFQWWYSYKIGKEVIHIPLQINEQYHKDFEKEVRFKSESYVKITKNKIHILTTKEFRGYSFKEFSDFIGIDINVKHNFCYLSDDTEIDYNRKWIGEAVKELRKLDKSKVKSEKQKKRISKMTRKNEWYFKNLISEILDTIEDKNISDIVLEDLNLSFGATFIKHPNFEIKYSRLVRILRLSNVKQWFIEQANKRGIRVHLTNPAYTSQTCPSCGCISRENRKTQELFECIECGHESNADLNAAINIRNRISSDVLREKLHTVNEQNGIWSPRRQKRETIKEIIISSFTV